MATIEFKQVPAELAIQLMDFVNANNIGKAITIDDVEYTLDFISRNSSRFFQSRGLSVYFRVDRSVIRISDHWAETNETRSRKFNCGTIDGHRWTLANTEAPFEHTYRAGKYPHRLLAGKASLVKLNADCDHWKPEAKKTPRLSFDFFERRADGIYGKKLTESEWTLITEEVFQHLTKSSRRAYTDFIEN
ncbi:hypothetical protein [Arcanobacterium phocae]|uniref:hypothetical protein n=1 Tax=Arcanobacterium phocae TaxID=131112 RepID=UPI001C0EEC62|nr:hypothetical protein [Arcanobacterium phocae]